MADELLIGKGDIVALSEVTPEIDALISEINRIEVAIQNVKKNPINASALLGMRELREAANQLNQSIQTLNTTITALSRTGAGKALQDHAAHMHESTAATQENTAAQKENLTYQQFVGQRMGSYMKIYGDHASAIRKIADEWKEYKATGQSVVATAAQTAGATKEVSSAYQKLQNETKQAQVNAKNLAAQFGVDSKEALEAAASYEVLKNKLAEVNSVTKAKKAAPAPFDPNSVPYTQNASAVDEEETAAINAKGQAVNALEKEQAQAANTAVAFGNAQLEATKEIEAESEVFPEIIGELDEYTGSITENIQAQLRNSAALAENRLAQKQLLAELSKGAVFTDEQAAALSNLKTQEVSLVQTNKELAQTIKNQSIAYTTANGSIDNLRAKVNLLQNAYEALSVEEKKSQFGIQLKGQIGQLEPTLKKAEGEIGKFGRNVGNYSNSITSVFSKGFGYIRQLAYILPGVGIAGILGGVSDAVVGVVKEMFKFESAEAKAERQTKDLSIALNQQKEAFNDYKDSVQTAVDKTVAKLKELGATQYEIENAKITGIGFNKGQAEKNASDNIATLNTYLNQLKLKKEQYADIVEGLSKLSVTGGSTAGVTTVSPGSTEANRFFASPLSKIADINISDGDIKNYEKIRDIANQIANLENAKGFSKLTDVEKQTFAQVKELTTTILSNVKDVKTFTDQIDQNLAEQNAQRVTAVRNATRERLEIEIETTSNINERNKKAVLDAIKFEQDVKSGNFDALRKQVIAERDFELNAEKGKIDKINAIRNLELAKPENTEADKIRINAQADRDIAAIRLTSKERQKIEKETASKLFDINEAERKRNLDADKQSFVQRQQLQVQLLNELSNNSEFGTEDRIKFLQSSFDAQKSILDKEHETLLASKQYTFLTVEEKFQIQVDYDSKLIELNRNTQSKIVEVLKSSLDKQLQLREEDFANIDRFYKQLDVNLSNQYGKELLDLNKSLKDKKISYEKYLKDRQELDFKYGQQQTKDLISDIKDKLAKFNGAQNSVIAAQRNVDVYQGQLNETDDPVKKKKISDSLEVAKKQLDIAKKNYDDQLSLEKQLTDATNEEEDKKLQHKKEVEAKKLQTIADTLGQISQLTGEIQSLGDAIAERRLDAIAQEQDALESRYQREIDLINQTYVNAVDRDRALKEAEARHAAQKKQLDDREKQEKIKQAKFDKEAGIARIILNTAQAVVAALASVPPNVPLSIAAGVIGAAELAVAIATPLPRFFKGKNTDKFNQDSYEGFALVNDGGKKEAIVRKDGSVDLPQEMNTIEWVGKDDIVLPDANMLAWQATRSAAEPYVFVTTSQNSSISREDYMYGVKNIVTAIKNQPKQRKPDLGQQLMKAWISSNKSYRDFFG